MKRNRQHQMLYFRQSIIQLDHKLSRLHIFIQTAHEDGFGRRFLHQCSIRDVALLAGLLIDSYPYLSGLQTMIVRKGQRTNN